MTGKLSAQSTKQTNFWSYVNTDVGTYPNTHQGYTYRAMIVQAGGSANLGLDAIYAQADDLDCDLRHPTRRLQHVHADVQARRPSCGKVSIGGFPPARTDAAGKPYGFWSLHVYQTDASEAAAPSSQASVLDTSYSKADLDVVSVDASTETLTVRQRQPAAWAAWGPLLASTPILFAPTAATHGLDR